MIVYMDFEGSICSRPLSSAGRRHRTTRLPVHQHLHHLQLTLRIQSCKLHHLLNHLQECFDLGVRNIFLVRLVEDGKQEHRILRYIKVRDHSCSCRLAFSLGSNGEAYLEAVVAECSSRSRVS